MPVCEYFHHWDKEKVLQCKMYSWLLFFWQQIWTNISECIVVETLWYYLSALFCRRSWDTPHPLWVDKSNDHNDLFKQNSGELLSFLSGITLVYFVLRILLKIDDNDVKCVCIYTKVLIWLHSLHFAVVKTNGPWHLLR